MSETWQYQVRVYLAEPLALEQHPTALTKVLRRHDATMVSQLEAFEAYVADAERDGLDKHPLYRWTKATLADPTMRAKHGVAFAIRVGGDEVYDKAIADVVEADLRALLENGTIDRLSKHDTNPANNIPIPAKYRS